MTVPIYVCTCKHLVASGWYLYYSFGFVPHVNEPIYNSLVCYAPRVIELEEELEKYKIPVPSTNEKEVTPMMGKGKGKMMASTQVSI